MSFTTRPRMTLTREAYEELRLERRTGLPLTTRDAQDLTDLRKVIHLLAMAMSEGKSHS